MGKYFIVTAVVVLVATLQYEVVAKPPLGILNGTDAEISEFPYLVQLLSTFLAFQCGGAILGPEWILTSASCIPVSVHSVAYGTNEFQYGGRGIISNSILAKEVLIHPKFHYDDVGGILYDVALIKLAAPIPFSSVAQPIKLAEANQDVPFHQQGVLAGWGFTETGASKPLLQKINLQLLTDEECTKKINDYQGEASFLSTHNLCTDNDNNGSCYGDGGSPFVINGTQYGYVSWSIKPCGILPTAYSRLTNPEYRDWIKNITNI